MTVTQSRARDVARKTATQWYYQNYGKRTEYGEGELPDAIVAELERQKMFATQDMLSLVEHAKQLAKSGYWVCSVPPTSSDLIRAIGQRLIEAEEVVYFEAVPVSIVGHYDWRVEHVTRNRLGGERRERVATFYGPHAQVLAQSWVDKHLPLDPAPQP